MTEHTLAAERLHFAWDNSLAPVVEIDPGDSVTCATWDASGHVVQRSWTSADAARRQPKPGVGHALTGPIAVHGARAGDTLVVEVLDVAPADWGFTMFSPGRGLLPDDFSSAYLRIWDTSDKRFACGFEGLHVPLAPFCGVMGNALAGRLLDGAAPRPALPAGLEDKLRRWASAAFEAVDGTGAPRVDFYCNEATGEVWLNEVNPCPGSFGYFLWEAADPPVRFTALLSLLIDEAAARHRERQLPDDPVPAEARLLRRPSG